jgi:pimeloyl-ACP methyl ester carboxylesterase
MTSRTDRSVRLSDGRNLGFAEFGDPQGKPVFLFHGQPGNRLFRHPYESISVSLGIRVITVDRPGYGLSDFQPGRKMLDWAQDIAGLADCLGIERFAVAGFSGGGPYAAACACETPERITATALVSCSPPMHDPEINREIPAALRLNYSLANHAPALLKLLFHLYWSYSRRNPEAFIDAALKQSSLPDRELLSDPGMHAMLLDVWKENIRIDSRGYVQDAVILMKDWGFSLRDIPTEVFLWQGEADLNVPARWAKYIFSQIPHCRPAFVPGQGHFLLFSHWKEIFQTLVHS